MTIDIAVEQVLTLREAARALPSSRTGKRVHLSTLNRWATRGCRGVRLETIRLGGASFTSAEALQRFADRLSGRDHAPEPGRPPPSLRARRCAHERVERELDRLGL